MKRRAWPLHWRSVCCCKGRVALALGDPIGPIEDAQSAIIDFRQFCLRNDWLPAFYQTLPANLEYYRADGYMRTTPVGVVRAPEGRITAFANLVIHEQWREVAVDLMRRRREVENGTMDFLFVNIIERQRQGLGEETLAT